MGPGSLLLLVMVPAGGMAGDPRPRLSRYGCEGTSLELSCGAGEVVRLVRANYGRFSLEVCNPAGNTSWSYNCIQHQTKAVLDRRCALLQRCRFTVSSELFGDPCPGTGKYLEVHYSCLPRPRHTAPPPAPPPWLLDLSATPPPRPAPSTRGTSLPPPSPSTAPPPAPPPSPPPSTAPPPRRQSYVLPAAGSGGRVVEEQQDHLVLGAAVAVSAVATVLAFLLSYQVWRRCRAKARSQSRLCQACSCQNVFYSYYDSGGSGQTSTTEVKSLGPEEAAYQLPYMVVVRGPPPAPGPNIYSEIQLAGGEGPGPPSLARASSAASLPQGRPAHRPQDLRGLSPIQIAFSETGQQFLHLNIQPEDGAPPVLL